MSLLFCAGMVIWVVSGNSMPVCTAANMAPVDPDLAVKTAVIQAAFFLAATIIGSYVFGATWEDNNKVNAAMTAQGNDSPSQSAITPPPSAN